MARPVPHSLCRTPALVALALACTLAAPARGSLAIYDAAGRCVRVLESGELSAGAHAARWDRREAGGGEARSGVYFARLSAGGRTERARFALVR